jgi:hypothetical protein
MTRVIKPKVLYMKRSWGLKSQKKNTIKIMNVKIAKKINQKATKNFKFEN